MKGRLHEIGFLYPLREKLAESGLQASAGDMALVGLAPAGELSWHFHPFESQVFIFDGEGEAALAEQRYEFRAPCLIRVPAELPHSFRTSQSQEFWGLSWIAQSFREFEQQGVSEFCSPVAARGEAALWPGFSADRWVCAGLEFAPDLHRDLLRVRRVVP